ncbi:flagellar hook-associated protein FlgL [Paenibacillus validus]|uniref:Flagellar hook-associated protein FlgL n=1 Tax=Paenibacillus validus TaxID=44253 RepID=A0A7X2ZDT0_9BACL|nr:MULTISPECIES: flagellar hook-associated protein FlgL [Paenibacillus]MED4600701.1 flagellar hook-associated protein FlgL [Paenibacillus validus]MED4606782.1 flagellar hook-associated protein FlgL [Paenibacillus validus]MUG72470.1 flagellar hook-associated protein FlgL [Paenibacillus validus]
MTTRVTQGMLNNQLLRNINTNLTRINNHQNQLSTGRQINKASDDPVGITFSLRYRSELSANDQYETNVDAAVSWLEYTDTMLAQSGEVLQRARELTVKAATGTNPQQALNAIKSEIDQLRAQLVNIGNSEFNGKYVFNGQLTDKAPYEEATAAGATVDHGEIKFEIGVGVRIAANMPGNKVFGEPYDPNDPVKQNNDNLFRVLDDLSKSLEDGSIPGIENALGRLDTRMDVFLEARADVGAKLNRIELAQARIQDINTNLQTLQSKTEDADIAEVITNLKTDENVYQASLSVGSKIISTSLVDFLR